MLMEKLEIKSEKKLQLCVNKELTSRNHLLMGSEEQTSGGNLQIRGLSPDHLFEIQKNKFQTEVNDMAVNLLSSFNVMRNDCTELRLERNGPGHRRPCQMTETLTVHNELIIEGELTHTWSPCCTALATRNSSGSNILNEKNLKNNNIAHRQLPYVNLLGAEGTEVFPQGSGTHGHVDDLISKLYGLKKQRAVYQNEINDRNMKIKQLDSEITKIQNMLSVKTENISEVSTLIKNHPVELAESVSSSVSSDEEKVLAIMNEFSEDDLSDASNKSIENGTMKKIQQSRAVSRPNRNIKKIEFHHPGTSRPNRNVKTNKNYQSSTINSSSRNVNTNKLHQADTNRLSRNFDTNKIHQTDIINRSSRNVKTNEFDQSCSRNRSDIVKTYKYRQSDIYRSNYNVETNEIKQLYINKFGNNTKTNGFQQSYAINRSEKYVKTNKFNQPDTSKRTDSRYIRKNVFFPSNTRQRSEPNIKTSEFRQLDISNESDNLETSEFYQSDSSARSNRNSNLIEFYSSDTSSTSDQNPEWNEFDHSDVINKSDKSFQINEFHQSNTGDKSDGNIAANKNNAVRKTIIEYDYDSEVSSDGEMYVIK